MAEISKTLDLLRFELKFLEDGGYGKSPHTPRKPTLVFEDSPTCLNFNDAARPTPCRECFLMQFVPKESQHEEVPCRFIPLTDGGQTLGDFYRWGTQIEVEEALENWLQREIGKLESQSDSQIVVGQASGLRPKSRLDH